MRPRRWPPQYPFDARYWTAKHEGLPEAHRDFILRMHFPAAGSRSTAAGRSHIPAASGTRRGAQCHMAPLVPK